MDFLEPMHPPPPKSENKKAEITLGNVWLWVAVSSGRTYSNLLTFKVVDVASNSEVLKHFHLVRHSCLYEEKLLNGDGLRLCKPEPSKWMHRCHGDLVGSDRLRNILRSFQLPRFWPVETRKREDILNILTPGVWNVGELLQIFAVSGYKSNSRKGAAQTERQQV